MVGSLPCVDWICSWFLPLATVPEEAFCTRSFPYEKRSHWSSDCLSLQCSDIRWPVALQGERNFLALRSFCLWRCRQSWCSRFLCCSARRTQQRQTSKNQLSHCKILHRWWFLAPWTSACQRCRLIDDCSSFVISLTIPKSPILIMPLLQRGCSKASGFICGRTSCLLQSGTARTLIQHCPEFCSSQMFQGFSPKNSSSMHGHESTSPMKIQNVFSMFRWVSITGVRSHQQNKWNFTGLHRCFSTVCAVGGEVDETWSISLAFSFFCFLFSSSSLLIFFFQS